MKSLAQKIAQCAGLIGTKDIDERTSDFLQKCVDKTAGNKGGTSWMTDRQVEYLEDVWTRNFA